MKAFAYHFSFEFRTGIRNKNLFLMYYLFPLGFYLLIGLIMPQINPAFLETMIPAMVVFTILVGTMLGLPDPLVTAREAGIFRSYKINGVPAFSILAIPALTTFLHAILASAIITATAPLFFDAILPESWPYFILVSLVTTFACAGLGVLIGVISPNSRMTVLWSQLIFVPSMLLGGLMMPYSFLPQAAGKIAQLLPATHSVNAIQGLAYGYPADFNAWGSVCVLLASGLLGFVLAIYLFNWDRHNTTQRGHPLLALLVMLPYVVGIFLL
jgi:ABC-2 type transport system permease protein